MKYEMPELKSIENAYKKFTQEADETVAKLKKKELATAVKKQNEVMEFIAKSL